MDDYDPNQENNSYVVSSYNDKIMFTSGAVFVLSCIALVLYHLFLRRSYPPSADDGHRRPRLHVLGRLSAPRQGLDARVLSSIPTFTYEPKAHGSPLVCAVCISEFEDMETGRVLPKCQHRFHLGCIDTWLEAHSDCPLCRICVAIDDDDDNKDSSGNGSSEVVVSISEAEPDDDDRRGIVYQVPSQSSSSNHVVNDVTTKAEENN